MPGLSPNSGERPTLSVIVPMFQSAPTIAQTLESLRDERVDGGLEVVVVNDGSTDDGPRIVNEHAKTDPRVRVVTQPNRGLASARNTGIAHARGTWLRFLDADDLATPGGSARLIRRAEKRHLPAACGHMDLIDEAGAPMERTVRARGDDRGTLGIEHFLDGNRCGVGTVVIRADALGGDRFDESLRVCEDWDLWLRLSSRGVRIAIEEGEPVKQYRVRRASLSKDFAAMLDTGAAITRRAFEYMRQRPADGIDDSLIHETRSMHRLALEWSTMRALSDRTGRIEEAREMFRAAGGSRYNAVQASESALWGALLGLGIRPELQDEAAATWASRTTDWWDACAAAGWLDPRSIPAAWSMLAGLMSPPMEIARQCVRAAAAAPGRCLTIIGAGENGLLLTKVAADSGFTVTLRDHRLEDGRLSLCDLPGAATSAPMSAPLPDPAATIVSMQDDERVIARLPLAGAIRWSVARRQLAEAHERWLREIVKASRNSRVGAAAGR